LVRDATLKESCFFMSSQVLIRESVFEGVVVLRLNRPEVLNALNLELRRALAQVFTDLGRDDTVKAIVLAGSAKAFCAGADLNEYVDANPMEIVARQMGGLWSAISSCAKPVVVALRGFALGGGLELAMHGDIIVCSELAKMGQPEVQIGLMPGGGATQRLTRAVGKFKAMKWLLTGALFSASEAFEMGLVSEVVPDEEVDTRALVLAKQLAKGPQQAIRSIKQSVLQSMSVPLEQGLEFERKSFQLLFATADKTEGIRARLEKRDAKFD
jgi:enoyl-CoA hydratase/carnithine racemase